METLASLLDEERSGDLKTEVIQALSYMQSNSPVAVGALRKAQDDPRESVSKAAADALKKLDRRRDASDSPRSSDDPFR